MRTKAKVIIATVGIAAYAIIKETINMEKRHEELNAYEDGVNSVVDKINEGIEVENVVNVSFKK